MNGESLGELHAPLVWIFLDCSAVHSSHIHIRTDMRANDLVKMQFGAWQ